jgi:hypothetical protein
MKRVWIRALSQPLFRRLILLISSAAIGWAAWSGDLLMLPLGTFFPLLWSLARTRIEALACSAAYFLAASRGLPQSVVNFYASDLWPGLLLWVIASLAFVIVHAACWTRKTGWRRPVCFLVVCIIMALPPFGVFGWAHPVTAAGVLFGGWGWWGLLALAAGLGGMTTRYWPATTLVLFGFWFWSAAHGAGPGPAEGWVGVDLQMGQKLGRDASLGRHRALLAHVKALGLQHPPGLVVVLPESTLGYWTPSVARLWQSELAGSGITVLAGAAMIDREGYDNVLVAISPGGHGVIYRQRMPVPGSMWQPWKVLLGSNAGARAHVLSDAVVEVGGQRVAPLICYEQLIVWPILQAMLADVDLILAVGNGWWTSGTTIIAIQQASVQAWARLFGKPLVFAFNM